MFPSRARPGTMFRYTPCDVAFLPYATFPLKKYDVLIFKYQMLNFAVVLILTLFYGNMYSGRTRFGVL